MLIPFGAANVFQYKIYQSLKRSEIIIIKLQRIN